VSVTEWVRV